MKGDERVGLPKAARVALANTQCHRFHSVQLLSLLRKFACLKRSYHVHWNEIIYMIPQRFYGVPKGF